MPLKARCLFHIIVMLIAASVPLQAFAETVKIGVLTTSGMQRSAYSSLAEEFEKSNPGVEIEFVFRADAEYKEDLKGWFSKGDGPDILNWQGGERLFQYVRKNHVKSLKSLWDEHQLKDSFSDGSIGAVSYEGEPYAIPTSYYHWGFFYRASLFERLNIKPPNTWQEFLAVCEALKQANIVPITIGAQYKWPTAAWFDYLNLRANGLAFHQSLLKGEVPFTDSKVREVFTLWKKLLDENYFIDRYNGWNWQQAMPFMYHNLAGMTLIGNFFAGAMPETLKDDFRFFRFPVINPDINIYEEAPLDLFMVPNYAKFKAATKDVLLFLANKSFQQQLNEKLGMIAPNIRAEINDEYFIQVGTKTLNQAAGVSQFFDRDTSAGMAAAATKIFTEFLDSKDIQATLQKLEQARQQNLL